MNKVLILLLLAITVTSCNVQERIFFNEHMGGTYETSFDLSSMLAVASKNKPVSTDAPLKKIDTLVVFSEMLEQFKDSIATLPAKKQAELSKLNGMTMHMQMDEAENIFKFSATKVFENFEDIAFVSNQLDEVFNMAKNEGAAKQAAGPGADMLKTDKVVYTFENNTFKRIDEKALKAKNASENGTKINVVEENEADDMFKGMLGEFDDLLKESTMTLIYSFPKKIASVSSEEAVISEDGTKVTYSVDWKTLMDNKKLLESFEVMLEDQ